jgi:hypothetical protein
MTECGSALIETDVELLVPYWRAWAHASRQQMAAANTEAGA